MPRTYSPDILMWTKAAITLRDRGTLDPSCAEIAKEAFGPGMLPASLIDEVRQNLETIKTVLREKKKINKVYCLGKGWYYPPKKRSQSFRKLPPQTKEECIYCAPMNRNGRWGLLFPHRKYSLMMQHMVTFHLTTSGSSNRHGSERLAECKSEGLIPVNAAKRIMKAQVKNLVPGNYKTFGQLWNGTPNPFNNPPPKK